MSCRLGDSLENNCTLMFNDIITMQESNRQDWIRSAAIIFFYDLNKIFCSTQ